jgi:hypothetical protein
MSRFHWGCGLFFIRRVGGLPAVSFSFAKGDKYEKTCFFFCNDVVNYHCGHDGLFAAICAGSANTDLFY